MRVVGTAGHVDHGKSALVRALTGTDPDRWEEERLRGMTLDLGFAPLRFADGIEAGIVDVPGHERFVHNMLAGATGMDVLLLVVAANEGPRPQTLEHLAILSLLDVPATIVVLSKSDLVDAAALDAARASLADAVAGSVAAEAPIVAVSSVTGDGLDELRARIHAALAGLPPRAVDAPPYLPVDRAFTRPGHGTVVTGTLMQGALHVGDTLLVHPGGWRSRVRALEVFGAPQQRVDAGARVAANLSGLALEQVHRGSALTVPEVEAAARFTVRFQPLPEALALLRRRTPVRVHLGAGESFGTLVVERIPDSAEPADAVLHLRVAQAAVAGQRFVVRRMSPKTVLGGGIVGASAAPAADDTTETPPEVYALRAALAAAGLAPRTVDELAAAANLRAERAAAILAEEVTSGHAWAVARPPAFVEASAAEGALEQVVVALAEHEAAAPWALGLTSLALARTLRQPEPQLARLLGSAVERERIAFRFGYYASLGFAPQLTAEQTAFFDRHLVGDPNAPLVPAPFEPFVQELRRSRIAGLSIALDTLLATGALVRVGDHVYRREQLDEIRARLVATLQSERRVTASRFRDVVGTSRKYAVPLLEFFDSSGLTVRDGDLRALRAVAR